MSLLCLQTPWLFWNPSFTKSLKLKEAVSLSTCKTFRGSPRTVLSNMVATHCRWLFRCKLIKVKKKTTLKCTPSVKHSVAPCASHVGQHRYRIVASPPKVLLDGVGLSEIKSKLISLVFEALNNLAPAGLSQFTSHQPFPCTLSSSQITQLCGSHSRS